MATKWVLTIPTSDGKTIHAEATRLELHRLMRTMVEQFGPDIKDVWKLQHVSAMWECDGRDNCMVAA